MAIISSAEIAKIFDEIRDQRDAANARAAQLLRRLEDAQTYVGKLESERDEARRQLEQAQRDFAKMVKILVGRLETIHLMQVHSNELLRGDLLDEVDQ